MKDEMIDTGVELWRSGSKILHETNTVKTLFFVPFHPKKDFFDPNEIING